jgi:hypothetical protein
MEDSIKHKDIRCNGHNCPYAYMCKFALNDNYKYVILAPLQDNSCTLNKQFDLSYGRKTTMQG